MKYITYIRVSTQRQGESGLGLEAQRETVRHYAETKKSIIISEYLEIESGKNDNRPELLKAINQSKQTGATLLIAKLDRLSRNVSFIFTLKDTGVQFECCDIPDANTLTIGIFATMAQFERERISERTKAALKAKKEQGYKLGSPQNLTSKGRAKGAESNRLKAKQSEENMRAKAFAVSLRDSNSSLSIIANSLNNNGFKTRRGGEWSKATVSRLLSRN